jgi:hypothetical protein
MGYDFDIGNENICMSYNLSRFFYVDGIKIWDIRIDLHNNNSKDAIQKIDQALTKIQSYVPITYPDTQNKNWIYAIKNKAIMPTAEGLSVLAFHLQRIREAAIRNPHERFILNELN